MSLSNYLFGSEDRKKLLTALFVEELELSAYDLAQLTGLAYATVYAEVKRLLNSGSLQVRTEKRAVLYRNNLDSKSLEALRVLLNTPTRTPDKENSTFTSNDVKAALSSAGAPLVLENGDLDNPNLSLEEAVVRGTSVAKEDPSVARALPVVLFKNQDSLDLERVLLLAKKAKVKHEVGFFLALTALLSNQQKFARAARKLKDHRVKEDRDFFSNQSSSPMQRRLAEENTPALAKRWRFRMNMSLATFQSTFDRFARVSEA